jgi:large subunit ribosomal protein L4
MAETLQKLVGDSSALLLMAKDDVNVEKSVRNLPSAKTLSADYLNVRDLLGYDRVIMPLDVLDMIQGYLGA